MLVADVPGRALAVYAHPDDADVSCGGTLALWAAAGSEVHLLIVTAGDKGSRDAAVDPRELARRRSSETDEAAQALGLGAVHRLGLPDGSVEDTVDLRRELVGYVRRLRPDAVLCPDPTALVFGDRYVNHRDHRVTGSVTLDAVASTAGLPLYFPDQGAAHQVGWVMLSGTLTPTAWVDVTGSIDAKVAAVQSHRSQVDGPEEWVAGAVRSRAADEGRKVGVAYAEAFRLVRLEG
jgi:LmbE family N-acetylglucosaminyl deacetylase